MAFKDFPSVGLYIYSDGSLFSGVYVNDVQYGLGKLSYINGDVYYGMFNNNCCSGGGSLTLASGDKYEGTFHQNQLNTLLPYLYRSVDCDEGKGRIFYPNGGEYTGEYKHGERLGIFKRHGVGVQKEGDGNYKGQWEEDQRHGKGREDCPNGDIFSGLWRNNVRHGGGRLLHAVSKVSIFGEWIDGRLVNSARTPLKLRYPDKGQWEGGILSTDFGSLGPLRHGHGKMRRADGCVIEGLCWKADVMGDGEGVLTSRTGDTYRGNFKDGVLAGIVRIDYKDGTGYYVGEVKDLLRHGRGTVSGAYLITFVLIAVLLKEGWYMPSLSKPSRGSGKMISD